MKKYFVLSLVLLSVVSLSAKAPSPKRKFSPTDFYFVQPSLSLHLPIGGVYYYGDVDVPGPAFTDDFMKQNVSWDASIQLAYPLSKNLNLRTSLTWAQLKGDNSKSRPDNYRKFKSNCIELAAGVQYYPFRKFGLYMSGQLGVAGTWGWHDFMYGNNGQHYENNSFNIAPMLIFGGGYSFAIRDHFFMSIDLLAHQAMVDQVRVNLDGYPFRDETGQKHGAESKWGDGWFSVGVNFAYRWESRRKGKCLCSGY